MGDPAGFVFAPASDADFEPLLALRIQVMREHLERLGRFDPVRARQRFRDSFDARHMRLILCDGVLVGCVALLPQETGWEVSNFYLAPASQNRGLGGVIMTALLEEADKAGMRLHLQVLRLSPAIRFYERHGFSATNQDDWDLYMAREPKLRQWDGVTGGE